MVAPHNTNMLAGDGVKPQRDQWPVGLCCIWIKTMLYFQGFFQERGETANETPPPYIFQTC